MNVDSGHPPVRVTRAPAERMEISERMVGTVTVVSLVGELDAQTAPVTQQRLVKMFPAESPMLFDLAGVSYISSAGLRTMLILYRQAQRLGVPIALVGISAPLRTMLTATGFLRFFQVAESVPDAIAAMRDPT